MKTAADIIKVKGKDLLSVKPGTTICDAIDLMNSRHVGSVFIEKGGQIVGIYTERNLLKDIGKKGFDPQKALIGEYMTSPLIKVKPETSLLNLQDIILGKRIRHILVTDDRGETLGVVSAGDVMKTHLNEISRTLESVSWEYYENWGFSKK